MSVGGNRMSTRVRQGMRFGALAAAVSATLLPAQGFAAGFALLEQSASKLGTAFAGTGATTEDASVMYYNPAGLSELDAAQFVAVGSGILISSKFRNEQSQPALGQPLGTNGGDAGDWNAVPSLYYARPVNERLAFGIGFNVPFGLKLEYPNDWIGRYQALNSEIQTYNFNPSLSWKVNDLVSLGVGVSFQRLQAELTNAVNYTAVIGQVLGQLAEAEQLDPAMIPGLIAANAGLDGYTRVRGHDTALGFNVGALFKLTPETRLGIAYRSSVDYTAKGWVNFQAPVTTQPNGAAIIAAVSADRLANGPVSVDLELPDSATLSLAHRIGDVELLADVAWTGWSSVPELRVVRDGGEVLSVTPEDWHDTWRYAIGATYQLNEGLKLRAGVAYDEAPVPDSTRTPRLPDPDRTWVAIGAQWKYSDSLTIDAAYAHLFSDDVPLDQEHGSAAANAYLRGHQESAVDIVSVQVAYRF
jgi:long-chain fatty acid transport protein